MPPPSLPARIVAAFAWLALALPAMPVNAGLPETVEHIKPSIVAIGTYQKTRSPAFRALGTGFAVGDGNLVATNAHVVPAAMEPEQGEVLMVLVRMANGETLGRAARKVASAPQYDLALLRFDGPGLAPLALHEGAAVREGQAIAFMGFPLLGVLGPYPATNRGIVSAITPIAIPSANANQLDSTLAKRLGKGAFDIYQLDATAYPGNSGSPVFDADSGEIIGIVNMVLVKGTKENVLSHPSGITYAIPVRYLQDLLQAPR